MFFLFVGMILVVNFIKISTNSSKGPPNCQLDNSKSKNAFESKNSPLNTVLTIEKRRIEVKIIDTKTGLIIQLNGNDQQIILDFAELRHQLYQIDDQSIRSLEIQNAPRTIIENQTFNGVNISILDSPLSIVRNNTIININDTSCCGFSSGIYLSNSSCSIIENNTISNIFSLAPSASVYGIFVDRSENTCINSNVVRDLIISSHSEVENHRYSSSVYGIYLAISKESIVNNNTIQDFTVLNEAPFSSSNTYGIYVENCYGSNVYSNIISNLYASANPDYYDEMIADAISKTCGIYVKESNNIILNFNYMDTILAEIKSPTGGVADSHGIYVTTSKNSIINSNSIEILRSVASRAYFYASTGAMIYGVHVEASTNSTISSNNIHDLFSESDGSIGGSANIYGIYVETSEESLLSSNTIDNFSADASVSDYSVTAHAKAYGIYMNSSNETPVNYNKISTLDTIASANPDSRAYAYTYGIVVEFSSNSPVSFNTISNLNATTRCFGTSDASIVAIIAELAYDNNVPTLSTTALSSSFSSTTLSSSSSSTSGWTFLSCFLLLGVFRGYLWRKKGS
jgi:parallel beta-helix repeat protein